MQPLQCRSWQPPPLYYAFFSWKTIGDMMIGQLVTWWLASSYRAGGFGSNLSIIWWSQRLFIMNIINYWVCIISSTFCSCTSWVPIGLQTKPDDPLSVQSRTCLLKCSEMQRFRQQYLCRDVDSNVWVWSGFISMKRLSLDSSVRTANYTMTGWSGVQNVTRERDFPFTQYQTLAMERSVSFTRYKAQLGYEA